MNYNLQPLRDLVDRLREDYGVYAGVLVIARELTAALDRMESQSCDCTAGTEHVHTGEQDD